MARHHKQFRGRHKFICDVDGMEYYSEHKRIRWDGAVVHYKNLESRHPQELTRAVVENTSVQNARPDTDPYIEVSTVESEDSGERLNRTLAGTPNQHLQTKPF